MDTYDLKKDIIEVGRRCWLRGWVAANDGNISIRLSENRILATATGQSKGFLTPDQIVVVDRAGRLVEGDRQPSSELQMHLLIYERRPQVGAIFHAHPPYCTAHAVAGRPLSECVLPEIVVTLGAVPLAAYGTPSTREVPESLLPLIDQHDAFLLANHGALTVGRDVFQAYYRMESIEHFAHILYLARGLGDVRILDRGQVEKLYQVRANYGLTGPIPACQSCPAPPGPPGGAPPPESAVSPAGPLPSQEELVRQVVTAVLDKLGHRSG